ncbi:MAG: Occludin/ELL family protein [Cyanobacteriota bacterium]|nr:Occludin/ELL family protein [Cyanobacteriota bacterium]
MTGIGVFGSALVSVLTTLAVAGGAMAGPVFCTTTVEAPASLPSGRGSPRLAPAVEITRCQGSQTVHELLQERFYSHTAPFEAGIGISHQITDLLGIARGGINGRAWMGFGFPDQTIVRDATAVQNTVQVLMEQQSDPMPWRTADLADVFTGSLSTPWQDSSGSMSRPARGL